nr:Cna B-type domain-containing protein [uncultured Lachnoanaerobaculum sp.]
MKRLTGIIMSFLMIFIMIFQGLNLTVYADGLAVDARITSFQILNTSNQPVTETEKSATLKLDFNFEMPESIFLDNGNYFDIKIPEEFDLTTAVTYPTTFDIKDENGTVVGTATIQPNAATATGGGGNVHVVFNENATGKYKFKGHLHFDLKINKKRVGDNQTINVKAGVNNREDLTPGPKPIIVKPDRALSTVEVIGKWAKAPTVPNQAAWGVRVNRTKQYLKNVVITDKITSNNGHFIDPDSLPTVITSENFKLMKCEYNVSGNPTSYTGEVVDISDKITFNEDKTEFRLDLGDIGTQSYFLSYKSTVEYGDIVQSNNATLTSSTNPTQSSSGTWKYRHSGGAAGGVLGKKLKLRKVDVDNGAPLAGATFKVTKSDGTSFNLITSADGTAISDQLMQGRYKVKEINAPEGYELDPNEYSVYVYDDVGGTLTIKDKMDKTYVKVSKEWVGPKGSSATIHLWADGVDTGKSVTLNERNNWQHTFEGLKKKNTDGSEIQYTVKEDAITNYDSSITGDMENGFTVTNTNTEKISVPVKKVWVGKEADSVTIKLLADGTEKESVTLTKDDNWEHTFSNLPKYADDGHEIEYTVDEVHIDGYSTTISGTAVTGFNITNTILITPVPPVTPTPVAPSPINPISPVTPVTPINPVNPITPSPISPVTPVTPINPVNPITPSPISPITPVSPSPINPITPSQITPSRIATPSQIITPGRDQDPVSRPNRPIATPSIATGSNTRGGGSSGGNSDVRPTKTVTVTDTNSKDAIQKPEIVVDEPKISNRNPQPDKNELKKDIKSSISATRRAMSVPKTSDRKDVRGYMFIFISSLAAAVIFWKKKETE